MHFWAYKEVMMMCSAFTRLLFLPTRSWCDVMACALECFTAFIFFSITNLFVQGTFLALPFLPFSNGNLSTSLSACFAARASSSWPHKCNALGHTNCPKFRNVVAAVTHQCVEWEWARAVEAIGLKSQKDSQLLKRNKAAIEQELRDAEISQAQFRYKGNDAGLERGQHCMESQAFVLMILYVLGVRKVAAVCKAKAMSLAVELLQLACRVAQMTMVGIAWGHGEYHTVPLQVNEAGVVSGLYALLIACPAALWTWRHLMETPHCQHKIHSSPDQPMLWDLLLLLVWAKSHPTTKNVWQNILFLSLLNSRTPGCKRLFVVGGPLVGPSFSLCF